MILDTGTNAGCLSPQPQTSPYVDMTAYTNLTLAEPISRPGRAPPTPRALLPRAHPVRAPGWAMGCANSP